MQRVDPRNVEGPVSRGISVWMTRANCELKPGYRNSIKPEPRRCSASRKDARSPADKTEHGDFGGNLCERDPAHRIRDCGIKEMRNNCGVTWAEECERLAQGLPARILDMLPAIATRPQDVPPENDAEVTNGRPAFHVSCIFAAATPALPGCLQAKLLHLDFRVVEHAKPQRSCDLDVLDLAIQKVARVVGLR